MPHSLRQQQQQKKHHSNICKISLMFCMCEAAILPLITTKCVPLLLSAQVHLCTQWMEKGELKTRMACETMRRLEESQEAVKSDFKGIE